MNRTRMLVVAGAVGVVVLAGVLLVIFLPRTPDTTVVEPAAKPARPPGWFEPTDIGPAMDPPAVLAFSSDQLQHTLIVPTLDTPMPKGKNVIWCGSFQMAWNHLRDDVIGEPPQVAGAEGMVARLNAAQFGEDDLAPDSYYAEAGFARDGIRERIQEQMQRRFSRKPELGAASPDDAVVAYAFVRANVPFEIPFFDSRRPLEFADSGGNKAEVRSFGIRPDDEFGYMDLRKQVEVLYDGGDFESEYDPENWQGFVIDPCRTTAPNQLILACLHPKNSLEELVADAERRTASQRDDEYERSRRLGANDILIIPNMNWDIGHHFRELEGRDRVVENEGFRELYLAEAFQNIRLRLDRSGAELAAEARQVFQPKPRVFEFNRPFLLYIKKRGGERPFFVMWVDNAELLSPF